MDIDEISSLGVATVLPVKNEPVDDFELNLPPINGEDYLRRVRDEARSCPSTVTAQLNLIPKPLKHYGRAGRSSAYHLTQVTTKCMKAPKGFAPSIHWQRYQVSEFSRIRMRLSRYIKKNAGELNLCRQTLPSHSDKEAWLSFCFGSPSTDELNEIDGNPALMSTVACLGQTTVLAVIEYHIDRFQEVGLTKHQGQWLYSLLAAIDKPLLPEACSLLRRLAELCSTLRATLEDSSDKRVTEVNLIICLVSRYFEQKDLADEPS